MSPDAANIAPTGVMNSSRKRIVTHFAEMDDEEKHHNNSTSQIQFKDDDVFEEQAHPTAKIENNDDKEEDGDADEREFVLDEIESSEAENCRTAWIFYLRSIGVEI